VQPASRPRFGTVLLDLDGTIWDSLPGIVRCLAHALEAVGTPVPSEDVLASNVGPPLDVMLASHGVPADRIVAARTAYRDRYQRLGEFECEVYPGAPELLDDLRDHRVRLATATSKGVEPTRRMLEHFDLARRFDVIAAATMDATAHHKIDVVRAALDDLSPYDPTRTVLVGDRSFDIDAGRDMGICTVGVTWGYGSLDELRTHGADHLADTFADLRMLVLGSAP
jgi:phosphoglycolate phosphatase